MGVDCPTLPAHTNYNADFMTKKTNKIAPQAPGFSYYSLKYLSHHHPKQEISNLILDTSISSGYCSFHVNRHTIDHIKSHGEYKPNRLQARQALTAT